MSFLNWDDISDTWSNTEEYWIIDAIISKVGPGGGPDEWYGAYKKLKKSDKRKIIKLVMYRNGIKFEQSRTVSIDRYKVTVNDIKSLVEEHMEKKQNIQIKISDIKI